MYSVADARQLSYLKGSLSAQATVHQMLNDCKRQWAGITESTCKNTPTLAPLTLEEQNLEAVTPYVAKAVHEVGGSSLHPQDGSSLHAKLMPHVSASTARGSVSPLDVHASSNS